VNFYRSLRKKLWVLSTKKLTCGSNITRYSMYHRLESVSNIIPNNIGTALSISGSSKLIDVMNIQATSITEATYPSENILSLSYADESFDFVLSDQVLEHIEGDPFKAIAECKRVLKPGGIAIHTTCFINPIHAAPNDFWRFTPGALKLLHEDWTKIIEVDGWGNQEVWKIVKDGIRGLKIPHAKWHPLHRAATQNDSLWPIVTWIVAVK
jgi:SAM-dependent methyltransferase